MADRGTKRRPPLRKFKVFHRVAILDEHDLPASGREPAVNVGPVQLERIAENANNRIERTNDWTPLTIGHTKDGGPELPVVGYAGNFEVGSFINDEGRKVKALFCDQYLDDEDGEADKLARRFPRRSVELWTQRLQVDPICMLGATSPERDLGVLIRYARNPITGETERVVRFASPKEGRAVAKDDDDEKDEKDDAEDEGPPKKKKDEAEDEAPPEDEEAPGEPPEENAADEMPDMGKKVGELTVGELFSLWSQTAPMKFLEELMQHAEGMGGLGDQGDEFGEPGMAGAGAAGAPPGMTGGPPPPHPDEEARGYHEGAPVRFEAGMGSPSAGNTYLPDDRRGYGRGNPRGWEGQYGDLYEDLEPENPPVDATYARPASADEVYKLSRELAEVRKKQTAQEKETASLKAENKALKRYNRSIAREAVLDEFVKAEMLDIDAEQLADNVKRFKVADLDDTGFEDFQGWLKRTYKRKLPNNGQRVDFARQSPRPGGPAKPTDPVRDEDESARIVEYATRNRIKDWDEAKRRYRAAGTGG